MSTDAAAHITEERIIQLVAEGVGMQAGERDHLAQCAHCRNLLHDLEDDLVGLRQQAARAAPAAERHFVLPTEASAKRPQRRRQWGWAALGTVFAAALLVLFFQMGPGKKLPGLPSQTPPVAEWKDPEMIQINRLAENPLPKAYVALSESLDDGYDESFIDFLIPPLEDESVS